MEELTKQVSIIAETVNKILENQGYMQNDISNMKKDILGLKQGQESIRKDILRLEARVVKLEEKLDKNLSDISNEIKRIWFFFLMFQTRKSLLLEIKNI